MYVLRCYPIRSLELATCLGYPAYFNGNEYFYGHSDPGSDMARLHRESGTFSIRL